MAKPFLPAPKPSAKKASKKESPALEAREEQLHRDLDGDGEKGESAAHKAKVFSKSPAKRGISAKPAAFGGKQAKPFGKGGK